jgi:hypothetical protein
VSFQYRFMMIWTSFLALFAPIEAPALVLSGASRRRRAATFIEYALLAGIALVLFFLFRDTLSDIFNSLFDRISGALD